MKLCDTIVENILKLGEDGREPQTWVSKLSIHVKLLPTDHGKMMPTSGSNICYVSKETSEQLPLRHMDSSRPGAGDRTSPNNSARLGLVHPEVIAEGRQLNGKCLGANAFLASIVFFSTIPHVLWLAFHVSRFFGGF